MKNDISYDKSVQGFSNIDKKMRNSVFSQNRSSSHAKRLNLESYARQSHHLSSSVANIASSYKPGTTE